MSKESNLRRFLTNDSIIYKKIINKGTAATKRDKNRIKQMKILIEQ